MWTGAGCSGNTGQPAMGAGPHEGKLQKERCAIPVC